MNSTLWYGIVLSVLKLIRIFLNVMHELVSNRLNFRKKNLHLRSYVGLIKGALFFKSTDLEPSTCQMPGGGGGGMGGLELDNHTKDTYW